MTILQWVGCALMWGAAGLAGAQALAPASGSPPRGVAAPPPGPAVANEPVLPAAPVSLSARKVYEQARSQLLQIRTLVKGQGAQTSVGSGFVVSAQGHIITNYHVVSEAALSPSRHTLVYLTADGHEAPLQLLMIDVRHDLALLKTTEPLPPAKSGASPPLSFRPSGQPMGQGERMYSLGNPLDVGFAVIEGNYNGLVERSFYPQIFFSGALSEGMSGGPALDESGRVIGVNVARSTESQLVSFVVPGEFASALLERGRNAPPLTKTVWTLVRDQLLLHQEELTQRFMRAGWYPPTHARYRVPVPRAGFVRCWGASATDTRDLDIERAVCTMDSNVFVGDFLTGTLAMRHHIYDGHRLNEWRFAARFSEEFASETLGRPPSSQRTRPQCHESFVQNNKLPMRAVVCLRAYPQLPELYDLTVLVVTVDQAKGGVQGRFGVSGLSYANAMKLSRHYLEGYGWVH
ncbi:MAG: hypothetical protein RLZZ618_254 [Pseudomonadota bacterium]|jgi:S1-C subfamily serine protease